MSDTVWIIVFGGLCTYLTRVGGPLVLPVGKNRHHQHVLTPTQRGFETKNLIPVQFVPMTGEAQGEKATDGSSKNPAK